MGGLDLSSTRDLTSFVLVFPDGSDGFDVLPYFWLPEEGLAEREDKDRAPYTLWKREGFLETTPVRAVNKRYVALRIWEIVSNFDCELIAFDRWRIEDFRAILSDEGIELTLEEFGQGFKSMAPAIDKLEAAIVEGRLRHGGHPLLARNAADAVVDIDPAGNRKLTKARSTGRIDGIVALCMALGVATQAPEEEPSVYETPGFFM